MLGLAETDLGLGAIHLRRLHHSLPVAGASALVALAGACDCSVLLMRQW